MKLFKKQQVRIVTGPDGTKVERVQIEEDRLRTMSLNCDTCGTKFITSTPKGKVLGFWDLFRIKELKKYIRGKARKEGWLCAEGERDYCPECQEKEV